MQSDNFGSHLKKIRQKAGYTMWELAKELGWEVNQVEQLERGLRIPQPKEITDLNHIFGEQLQECFTNVSP